MEILKDIKQSLSRGETPEQIEQHCPINITAAEIRLVFRQYIEKSQKKTKKTPNK